MAKPGFYAVRRGRQPGVYTTWSDAEAQVKGFTGAVHKKFSDRQSAEHYVNGLASSSSTTATSSLAATQAVQRPKRESPEDSSKDTRPTKLAKLTASSGQARKDETRIVYCDGSSRGNGQKGAVAGIGVVWQQGVDASNLSERLPGKLQTNNRAEMYASPRSSTMIQHVHILTLICSHPHLQAVARILEEDPHPELPLTICSDSQYTISVFSQWIPSWRARNWRTSSGGPVMNQDLILYILSLIASRPSPDPNSLTSNISFRKVKAHVGIEANEEADRLANLGAFKPVTKDRDFAKEAKDMEDKVKREKKGIKRADSVEFEVEVDAADLLTDEELRELEKKQDF